MLTICNNSTPVLIDGRQMLRSHKDHIQFAVERAYDIYPLNTIGNASMRWEMLEYVVKRFRDAMKGFVDVTPQHFIAAGGDMDIIREANNHANKPLVVDYLNSYVSHWEKALKEEGL